MIEKCDDPACAGFGKQFVDRGYGYPVCPSTKQVLNPKPMNPLFKKECNVSR